LNSEITRIMLNWSVWGRRLRSCRRTVTEPLPAQIFWN